MGSGAGGTYGIVGHRGAGWEVADFGIAVVGKHDFATRGDQEAGQLGGWAGGTRDGRQSRNQGGKC